MACRPRRDRPLLPAMALCALAGLVALLSACTLTPMAAVSPAQTVQLDGVTYRVEQITASTWTVASPTALPDGPQKTARLVGAIEKASGCKVTDSSYGRHGSALNAQVDCAGSLRN